MKQSNNLIRANKILGGLYKNLLKLYYKKLKITRIKKDGQVNSNWIAKIKPIGFVYFWCCLLGYWLQVHDLILVLNFDSSVSSLSDCCITSQTFTAKEERLSVLKKVVDIWVLHCYFVIQ